MESTRERRTVGTTRIPPAEITGFFGYLLKRMSRKMLGEVPEGLGVMWHNRRVLMGLSGFGRKVQKKWNEAFLADGDDVPPFDLTGGQSRELALRPPSAAREPPHKVRVRWRDSRGIQSRRGLLDKQAVVQWRVETTEGS